MKSVSPSIDQTAFNCPHCGALAQQFWKAVYCADNSGNNVPTIWTDEQIDKLSDDYSDPKPSPEIEQFLRKMATGEAYLEKIENGSYVYSVARNVSIALCYNCKKLSIWVYDRLFYPNREASPIAPNEDMPDDVRRDFEEAGQILQFSPRGAAALLRLSIQKLCKVMGQKGDNINEDIATLVKNGLSQQVQQALDVVRVIGNSAVHPGQLDIRDDHTTAILLFKLVNIIVEKTISEHKHIADLYQNLPNGALEAIKKRDRNS